MSGHVDDATLAELVQGALPPDAAEAVQRHLADCAACRSLVGHLLTATPATVRHGPRRGLEVGRYVVLDEVGAGAIGEVFSAHDTTLDRTVALKWLYPPLSGAHREALRARLLAEARTLARVPHPNVVAVHDVLEHQGAEVIVMELVRGARDMRRALGTGSEPRAVVRAFVDAAAALAAAHDAGVVHRDFKPENVLVDATGRVVVVDFGLARAAPVELDATGRSSTLSGTPAYLAPERWSGREADAASDQFAFCASLHELLAGALPFESRTLDERLASMRRGPPTLPSSVPDRVRAAVRRGLEADPAKRWPSMHALRAELVAALEAPSRRRTAMVAGALLLMTVSGATFAIERARSRCASADAPVLALWSPPHAEAITKAFAATGHPAAADLAQKIVRRLDGHAQALADVRRRSCEATAFHGESETLLAQRQACAQRRQLDLGATVQALELADRKTVERSVLAVEALAPPAACFEGEHRPLPPSGPSTEAVQAAIAKSRAIRQLGQVKNAVALAVETVERARALGWAPLTAEAVLEWATGLERMAKLDEARAGLLEAIEAAALGPAPELSFDAMVELAYLDGVDRKKAESGAIWSKLARAQWAPARTKGTSAWVRLMNADAMMALRNDRAAEGAVILQQVEAALVESGQMETLNGARLLANLSGAQRESGDAARGAATGERSLALMRKVLSANHPDVAAAENNIGSALADLERYDEAEPHYRASIALRETLYGADAPNLATPHYNLGELAFRRGDGSTALAEYARSRAIVEKHRGGDDADAIDARMGEGLSLGLLGRHAESLEVLEQVLPRMATAQLPAWNIAEAKLGIVRALRALRKDPKRVATLLSEVAALEGPRHEKQRAQAKALLGTG